MMSADRRQSDDDHRAPRLSDPTAVDLTDHAVLDSADGGRHTQLSDPPTAIVRRESFRELPPGSVVGDIYEVDARIGAGAMGEVYAARHLKLGKRVAIKVIGRRLSGDDAAIERFAMEARTLAQVQHPAIVAVEHVGELADGRAYFVMEFLRGETLFDRLSRGRPPIAEALRVLDQMARGLEAAHQCGVVHRDLKPENVFLVHLPGEPAVVKLVDFGLAKLKATDVDAADRPSSTQSGVAIGTPMYMSPEQARGPDVDHRTDIYALGCIAYELVLGRPPFPHARTAPEFWAAHLSEAPPVPRSIWPEIPTQLDLALFAMLAKDPAHRPTLTQVRAVFASARSTSAHRAATEFVRSRAPKVQRRMLVIGTAVLLALAGGVTIGSVVSRSPREATTVPMTSAPKAVPPVPKDAGPAESVVATPAADPTVNPKPPLQEPRSTGTSRSKKARQPPKVSVSAPTAPIDAGVDAATAQDPMPLPPAIDKPPPKDKPVDRNQTINPFAKKRPKVNP